MAGSAVNITTKSNGVYEVDIRGTSGYIWKHVTHFMLVCILVSPAIHQRVMASVY